MEEKMACDDPRRSDEERARAALEEMDDAALAAMANMMEEVARKNPRPPRASIKIVGSTPDPEVKN
jgi:hypothetical protein